ncbi:FecR family protein [Algoriphagus confluentis]|uniref:FecR family protein n=1 Tax=Algoriphagus confluentis TaxID=1697556 RepID=A0ABQ6PJM0_9BACT|nr:hypothetical protein Aconfl_07920 [Algoriphagus confluentis]
MKRVEKFLTNQEFVRWVKDSDPELDAYWNSWITAHPEFLPEIKKAREIVLGIQFQEHHVDPEVKAEILTKILQGSPSLETATNDGNWISKNHLGFWSRFSQFQRISAILFIAILFSWLIHEEQETPPIPIESNMVSNIEKITSPGEKLFLTLPDGTEVWLNSSSSLVFPPSFDGNSREVQLKGEGFFKVAEDLNRPFSVVSEGVITTALGTSFNINTEGEERVKVSLVTGKVKILEELKQEEFFLNPGQQMTYNLAARTGAIQDFSIAEITAWKDGVILFKKASLNEVVKKLENWYGVKINLSNAENVHWEFSGEYQNQILENVLKSMSYVEGFDYRINEKVVEIKF